MTQYQLHSAFYACATPDKRLPFLVDLVKEANLTDKDIQLMSTRFALVVEANKNYRLAYTNRSVSESLAMAYGVAFGYTEGVLNQYDSAFTRMSKVIRSFASQEKVSKDARKELLALTRGLEKNLKDVAGSRDRKALQSVYKRSLMNQYNEIWRQCVEEGLIEETNKFFNMDICASDDILELRKMIESIIRSIKNEVEVQIEEIDKLIAMARKMNDDFAKVSRTQEENYALNTAMHDTVMEILTKPKKDF